MRKPIDPSMFGPACEDEAQAEELLERLSPGNHDLLMNKALELLPLPERDDVDGLARREAAALSNGVVRRDWEKHKLALADLEEIGITENDEELMHLAKGKLVKAAAEVAFLEARVGIPFQEAQIVDYIKEELLSQQRDELDEQNDRARQRLTPQTIRRIEARAAEVLREIGPEDKADFAKRLARGSGNPIARLRTIAAEYAFGEYVCGEKAPADTMRALLEIMVDEDVARAMSTDGQQLWHH